VKTAIGSPAFTAHRKRRAGSAIKAIADVARPVGHDRLEAGEGIGLGVIGLDTFGLSGAQVETGAREQTHTDEFV
jgi:hypothetical protein